MTATQTLGSASLVALLVASTVPAFAEPDEVDPEQPAGEVRDDDTMAPGETPARPPDPPPPPLVTKRRPTGRFQIGAGFSTDDSFIAAAEIAQDDLFGTGHRLALSSRISAREQSFKLGYDIPHLLGSEVALHSELYSIDRQLPGFHRFANGGALSLSAPVGDHVRAFFGYRLEHVATTLDTPAAVARGETGGGASIVPRDGVIAALSGGLVYSTLDEPFLPTKGTQLGASIEVADRRWGSQIQLTRMKAWGSLHRSAGPFIIHLGGSVASVSSRDLQGVPLGERLHLDGSHILRGYAPGSIGPYDDANGVSLGGNFEFTARGELELPLFRAAGISAVGWVDHAGIFDRSGIGGMGASVGFGLVWRSPIGPLRFDWAFPLGEDTTPRFVFGIGSMF